MGSNHTPGPWTIKRSVRHRSAMIMSGSTGTTPIARVYHAAGTKPYADANADVIRAAPDLVALVYHLRHCVECCENDVMNCNEGRDLWAKTGLPDRDVP